jgi:hypothetical protein
MRDRKTGETIRPFGYDLDSRSGIIRGTLPPRVQERDYGSDPIEDGIHVRMIPSGEIVTAEEARKRLAAR